MADADPPVATPEPPWPQYQDIKDWIAAQEAYEATNKKPAPLTAAQRKAIPLFRVQSPALPDIGDRDWVSLLLRYRAAHPDDAGVTWEETQDRTGQVCRIKISESPAHLDAPVASFPGPGWGMREDGVCHAFPKKKEAKQYAAKCAVQWLMAQKLMPDNGKDVSFPRPRPSPAGTPQPSARKRLKKGTAGPVDARDESLPATQRVPALCRELGIAAPSYRLAQDAACQALWSGGPDWQGDATVPASVGRVLGIYGKQNARERIAEEVLDCLVGILEERTLQAKMLLAD